MEAYAIDIPQDTVEHACLGAYDVGQETNDVATLKCHIPANGDHEPDAPYLA